MIHGKYPGWDEGNANTEMYKPYVEKYLELLDEEKRELLLSEAKEGLDKDFLEKIDDDISILLPYIHLMDETFAKETIDQVIQNISANENIVKEEIDYTRNIYKSELKVFKTLSSKLLYEAYVEYINKSLN